MINVLYKVLSWRILQVSYEEDRLARPYRWDHAASRYARPVAPVGGALAGRVHGGWLRGSSLRSRGGGCLRRFISGILLHRRFWCSFCSSHIGCWLAGVVRRLCQGWRHSTAWRLLPSGAGTVLWFDTGLLCLSTFPFCCYCVSTTVPVVANGLSRAAFKLLRNLTPLVPKFVVIGGNNIFLLPCPLRSFDAWVQNITPTASGNSSDSGAMSTCYEVYFYSMCFVANNTTQSNTAWILEKQTTRQTGRDMCVGFLWAGVALWMPSCYRT